MFGMSQPAFDETALSVFVHTLKSGEAFTLAQKVWQNNARTVMYDPANHKELLRFVFSQPDCVVWLQRDQGSTDTFELILIWSAKPRDITEVFVVETALPTTTHGDDNRVRSLLNSILSSPAMVPINQQRQQNMPQPPPQRGGK